MIYRIEMDQDYNSYTVKINEGNFIYVYNLPLFSEVINQIDNEHHQVISNHCIGRWRLKVK